MTEMAANRRNSGAGFVLGFCLMAAGFLLGYGVCWFQDATTPYIDRETAIRYGLENAQGHCSEAEHVRPVDCVHFRLTDVQEAPAGWFLTFRSANGRREDSMIIRRKGEYDSTGGWDLDDPKLAAPKVGGEARLPAKP